MIPKSPLGLRFPEQTEPPREAIVLDPGRTASWISNLPLANVGETSRRVFKTIVECNRYVLPDQTRLKVMEQFLDPTAYVVKNLEKYYIGAAFPLTPKIRKIAVLSRELHIEIAIGYKQIIANILNSESAARFDNKLLVVAIYRALSFLSKALLHTYLVYDPAPENSWLEMHRLASYALHNQLHEMPVTPGSKDENASTIADLYVATLLLSLAEPQRLRQKEILLVSNYIANWSRLPKLISGDTAEGLTASAGLFISDLLHDAPPVHCQSRSERPSRQSLLLDTSALTARLAPLVDHSAPAGTPEEQVEDDLDLTLVKKLIKVWSQPHSRKHARTRLHFQLKVAVGLNAIHGLMTAGQGENNLLQIGRQPPEKPDWVRQSDMLLHTLKSGFLKTEGTADLSLSPLDDSIGQTSRTAVDISIGRAGPDSGDDELVDVWSSRNPASYETHVFRTVDESAGGYRINWNGRDIPRITVGELIGIQSATKANQFGITLVKWLRHTPQQGLQLGTQMLAPNASAVEVRPHQAEEEETHQCLLLPEVRASSLRASLLTPVMCFTEGELVTLIEKGRERRVRLTLQIEKTGSFSQFLFSNLQDEGDKDSVADPDDLDGDYDSIWSTL